MTTPKDEQRGPEHGVNDAETYAYHLARKTFLNLWSYLNPRRPDNGRELCDVVVMFDQDIVLFSVKDIELTQHEDSSVPPLRWQRKAIDASAKQLDGAQRVLGKVERLVTKAGQESLPVPKGPQIHRVAVAFGSSGEVPLYQGLLGDGFTHVFDEISLRAVLSELDTISDFLEYLRAKEGLFASVTNLMVVGGERDLVASYLYQNRKFSVTTPAGTNADAVIVTPGIWDRMQAKPEYRRKKEADRISYFWDAIIATTAEPFLADHPECVGTLELADQSLRVMARESRFNRRLLGEALHSFWGSTDATPDRLFRRVTRSPGGMWYVFHGVPGHWDRERRGNLLEMTMHVVCGKHKTDRVLGISMTNRGCETHQNDILYIELDRWSSEDQARMEEIQRELGILVDPTETRRQVDEYPQD